MCQQIIIITHKVLKLLMYLIILDANTTGNLKPRKIASDTSAKISFRKNIDVYNVVESVQEKHVKCRKCLKRCKHLRK